MTPFKTIVILDLETTGLPQFEHGLTKITEMSLVACLTAHCEGENMPRVLNKLTLPLNPMKKISPDTAKLTGLENDYLEEMKTFDDSVVKMLNIFLERLPQDVCIIAHNGNHFDFPILMKHLKKCKTPLIDKIYCADSLPAFKAILQRSKPHQHKRIQKNALKQSKELKSMEKMSSNEKTPQKRTISHNFRPVKPPVESCNVTDHSKVWRKLNFDTNTEMIEVDCDNNSISSQKGNSISKDNSDCEIVCESIQNQRILKSHKLIDIYSYLHNGDEPTLHRSEEDCLALLSCIIKCKDDFFDWLSENARLLSQVEPLF